MDIGSPKQSSYMPLQTGRATTSQAMQQLRSSLPPSMTVHTRSRTAQSRMTENLTHHPKTYTAPPIMTKITDTPDAMPKPLTKDRLQALLQMQRTDPFCKCISKHLSNRKSTKT